MCFCYTLQNKNELTTMNYLMIDIVHYNETSVSFIIYSYLTPYWNVSCYMPFRKAK